MNKKFLFLVLLMTPTAALAIGKEAVMVSPALTESLGELRSSIDRLAASNDALASKNAQLKERLSAAQVSILKFQQENQTLNGEKLKLEAPNAARTRQAEALQKKLVEMDTTINSLREEINLAQSKLEEGRKEDDELSRKIEELQHPAAADNSKDPEIEAILQQKKKEKLAALKMIAESQAKQVFLQEQLMDLQKSFPETPDTQNAHHKSMLETEIAKLEQENAQLNHLLNNAPKPEQSSEQIKLLEKNVFDLEKNRDELKELVAKMQKKARKVALTPDQRNEQEKLQYNIEQLKADAKSLRLDLEEAQQQMVELDKRKARLEQILGK